MAGLLSTRNKGNRIISSVPNNRRNLVLSKTDRCPACGSELEPFIFETFGTKHTFGFVPCGCSGYREWSERQLHDVPEPMWNPTVPKRYEEAAGGEDYANQVANGRWLYISGDVGVGKTYLAASILKVLARKGSTEFVSAVNATNLDAQDSLKKAKFLVIDDLGKETSSEWSVAKIWEVIDYRYSEMKPTVITSQYTLEQLPDRIMRNGDYGSALSLVSRLYEVCDTVRLSGSDRRLG